MTMNHQYTHLSWAQLIMCTSPHWVNSTLNPTMEKT